MSRDGPLDRLRLHKICGVSSTGTVGDNGPGAMEHCFCIVSSRWVGLAGVSLGAPAPCNTSICGPRPERTAERGDLFEISNVVHDNTPDTIERIKSRQMHLPANTCNWFKSRKRRESRGASICVRMMFARLIRVTLRTSLKAPDAKSLLRFLQQVF